MPNLAAFSANNSTDDDDGIALAPAEQSRMHELALEEARRLLFRAGLPQGGKEQRLQYSMKELAALITVAAMLSTVAHYLPLAAFSATMGAAGVLAVVIDYCFPHPWLTRAWIALGLAYLMGAAMTLALN